MEESIEEVPMDQECVLLCEAMNKLPGIETGSSCCGHGEREFHIIFSARTIAALMPILKKMDKDTWAIKAWWTNGKDLFYFCLEGPVGDFEEANLLAEKLMRP